MAEIFENASDIIMFIPHSQYRWAYAIDNGKKHVIHQDDVIKFVKKYISQKQVPVLNDIMMRHQPFIVVIADKSIVELHKEEDTLEEHRKQLALEIDHATKNVSKNFTDKFSDERFSDLIANFTKI